MEDRANELEERSREDPNWSTEGRKENSRTEYERHVGHNQEVELMYN